MFETDLLGSLQYFLWIFLTSFCFLTNPSNSATDSFIFGGCSQLKYLPNSPYESNVNSLLTSLVNSAMYTSYNNFTFQSSAPQDTLYGLFQCRGDLKPDECARCVAHAVSQLGTLCLDSCGGALQNEGCFVKYDNVTFLGVEDKTEVLKKCGPSIGYESDALNQRDGLLAYLGTNNGLIYKPYRFGGSGKVQGMAQCVGDLSPSECNDCLSEAIQRLKNECGPTKWGEMYLAKCYLRYWEGDHSSSDKGKLVSYLQWWFYAILVISFPCVVFTI